MDKAGNPVSGLADQLQLTGAPALGSGLGEVKFTEDPDRPGTYTAQVSSTSIASGSDLQVQVAGQNVGSPLAYDFIDGTTGAVTITAAEIGPDGAVTITGTAAAPAGSAVEITLPNGTKLTGTVADAAGNFELTGTAQEAAGLKAGDPLTVQVTEANKLPAQASGQFIKLLPAPAVTASADVPGNLTATVTVPADTPAGTIIVLSDGQGTSLGTATYAGDGQPVVISVPAPAGAGVTTVTANLLVPAETFTRAPAAGTGPVATPDRTATPVVETAVVTPDGLLTVTGNVPGTKAGEPVTITLPDGQQLTGTIVDDQGNFVLTGMPQTPLKPGAQLSVTATATGLYPATPAQVPVAFSQFTPPTNIQAVLNPDSGSTSFTADAAAADGTPATITLPDGSTITAQVQGGKIVAVDGQPLVIPGLHAGEQLQVSLGTGAAASPAATGTVTVANMQPPVVTDIVRDPETGNVTITGYLPGAGAGVTVQAVNPDTNEVIGTDTTDEDGAFEILVPADLAEGISDFTVRAADRQTTATKRCASCTNRTARPGQHGKRPAQVRGHQLYHSR